MEREEERTLRESRARFIHKERETKREKERFQRLREREGKGEKWSKGVNEQEGDFKDNERGRRREREP